MENDRKFEVDFSLLGHGEDLLLVRIGDRDGPRALGCGRVDLRVDHKCISLWRTDLACPAPRGWAGK